MSYGVFVRPRFIVCIGLWAWFISSVWVGVDLGNGTALGQENIHSDHWSEVLGQARPDRQLSELTSEVVASFPLADTGQYLPDERNLIDRHLFSVMRRDNIPHARLSNDYEFVRRIYLDLTGRIPTRTELTNFITDNSPDKRSRLIDRLLETEAWVDHWTYWYSDLVRMTHNRIGNAAMKHFDLWLRQSFREDKPYDQLVTELLTTSAPGSIWMPDAAPATYLARWYVAGDTMYTDQYEDTADEIIVQSARIFLGINYQCISCHVGQGFLERVSLDLVSKTRRDFWAMAAFFGKTRVRAVWYQDRFSVTDDGIGYDTTAESSVRLRRYGLPVEPTFILTGEKGDPSKPLRTQFARMLTDHPQFARATTNLIWKQFFGLGIVEPVDAFDMARQDPLKPPPSPWSVQPTNAELLDELANDFSESGFSLKHLMRRITLSNAYQLSSRFEGRWEERYTPYFARKFVRRLTAEQIHDAVSQATQVFGDYERKDLVYRTPVAPVHFWTELATPEEVKDVEAKSFLQAFGPANREQFDRRSGGSILQAMSLMNSPFVTRRVRAENGSVVEQLFKSTKSSEEIVDELYLRTLSRHPSREEQELAMSWIDEDRASIEDLHWSLLNKLDFIFNY